MSEYGAPGQHVYELVTLHDTNAPVAWFACTVAVSHMVLELSDMSYSVYDHLGTLLAGWRGEPAQPFTKMYMNYG